MNDDLAADKAKLQGQVDTLLATIVEAVALEDEEQEQLTTKLSSLQRENALLTDILRVRG